MMTDWLYEPSGILALDMLMYHCAAPGTQPGPAYYYIAAEQFPWADYGHKRDDVRWLKIIWALRKVRLAEGHTCLRITAPSWDDSIQIGVLVNRHDLRYIPPEKEERGATPLTVMPDGYLEILADCYRTRQLCEHWGREYVVEALDCVARM